MKFTLIFILSLLGTCSYTQNSDISVPAEKLNYTIYFKTGFIWVAIGEMNMNTNVGQKNSTVHLYAKTYKKWKSFKDIEIDIKAAYNNRTRFSESYIRHSIENGAYIRDSIIFDQVNFEATEIIEESGEERKEYVVPLTRNVVDILTSLSLLRSQLNDLEVDEHIESTLFYSRYEYPLIYKVEKKAVQKIRKIGKRNCVLLSTTTIAGRIFSNKSKLQIWMSTDHPSIPYMFETPFKFGVIRVVLNDF